jgi:hypothetical protein
VLSAIGLSLDLVGATMLSLGLYAHSRLTYVGISRGPADVAQDAAFGTVGATLLAAGFVLQALQYVGVTVECTDAAVAMAAVGTIGVALVVSWLGYGLIYIWVHRREEKWVRDHQPQVKLQTTRRVSQGRLGWRFWRHEPYV